MKYYFIAGEASGDLHASNLARALYQLDPEAEMRGYGGDHMSAVGIKLTHHIREMDYMGFVEVAANFPAIYRLLKDARRDLMSFRPDVLILVDYPGFNMRMAEFARKQGLRVVYYISPQLWAWHSSRVNAIRRNVHRMITILPFEKEFYANYGLDVFYAGHPLLDVIARYEPAADFKKKYNPGNNPIIALLPGSRRQEIARILPTMLQVTRRFPEYQFIVGAAAGLGKGYIERFVREHPVKIIYGQTYDLLSNAYAAIVTSGTASLETALFGVPQVIVYKGNFLSYLIARQLVKVNYIGLPNLILNKPSVRELIQKDFNAFLLYDELDRLVKNEYYRQTMLRDFAEIRQKLGGPGASERAAREIVRMLNEK
ncbi:MAG: lipid-A-disaccharide synthase [Bacteroidales bacterium]|jgi:lipid-A-disaccharide synthase|nr:lipid-A-disaccharide synthase [Bacteroidales bacterium]MDN5328726.1 lipid-A-disaccharide synthase [Bacteroidales bacterium]NLH51434.1 lipid-A-disaccharide synthase [Bacteroidales bacterium]NPV36366.1 lipid-A-disaccharide synthase [Bacteroidales bacterium]